MGNFITTFLTCIIACGAVGGIFYAVVNKLSKSSKISTITAVAVDVLIIGTSFTMPTMNKAAIIVFVLLTAGFGGYLLKSSSGNGGSGK